MMQVYQLTLSPANMGSPRRVSVLKANIRKMQVCCHLYSKHKTRPLIIPCVQSCVFLKLRPGQLPMLGGCRNTPLPAPFAYRETAAPAFLYRHAPFLLLGFMLQLIARHLLHTLNVIVVESFTTPHHYCPMCVQQLPALTVTKYRRKGHKIRAFEVKS